MKKIYLSLLACAGLTAPALAQDLDLQGFVILGTTSENPLTDTIDRRNDDLTILDRNKYFTPTAANAGNDSVYGYYGVFNNGPDVYETSSGRINFMSSYSRYLTQFEFDSTQAAGGIPAGESFNENKYFWVNAGQPNNDAGPGETVMGYSYGAVNDITMVVDWNKAVTTDSIQFLGPPHNTLVNNTDYGFFIRVYGVGGTNTTVNFDANTRNNFYMQKIQFTGTVGIKAVSKERQALNAYPNPATSSLNVKFDYTQNTTSAVFVRDITGRVVKFENYGVQTTGEKIHNIDLSGLAAGTYTVELATGEVSATTKVIVK